ncbi:hypothetical protein PHYBOEH_011836 [Phytophthora boehmeriae]|uniref:Proteasome assembly chaperone 1 n=1 Tax=Phytophthora boehmeriae TaxID=109152 RepID=A0A8T1WYP5_9STRA|nr:hypothetical protein PHYBOEH_011836 [Phytophthora boehmeriae]
MALALRFAEEGEFSSRACNLSSLDTPDVAPSTALFRWSKPVRNLLGPAPVVSVETLIVAMPGAAQSFVQELASSWETVGTLVATDQAIAHSAAPSAGILLSKKGVKVSEAGNALALLVGQEVPVQGTWSWLNKLLQHVDAQDVVCLDSQLSTIYADQFAATEPGPQLRMLASSAVSDAMKLSPPVRPLETPQFVAGIPAALLTHGELRKRRVLVFVSLRDVSALPGDVMRSFLPLAESSSSVLGALERPLFYQPSSSKADASANRNVLYT